LTFELTPRGRNASTHVYSDASRSFNAYETTANWDVPTAARSFWAVMSQRVWDDLVMDQDWPTAQYRNHITALHPADRVQAIAAWPTAAGLFDS
jgi:hypothetical protein